MTETNFVRSVYAIVFVIVAGFLLSLTGNAKASQDYSKLCSYEERLQALVTDSVMKNQSEITGRFKYSNGVALEFVYERGYDFAVMFKMQGDCPIEGYEIISAIKFIEYYGREEFLHFTKTGEHLPFVFSD